MSPTFERIVQTTPPFDKRSSDPKKNYGIGGLTLRYILKGPKGATQFVFYTCQHQKHVADELVRQDNTRFNRFHGMGADVGCHSPVPMYEGQTPMKGKCDVLGGTCYYDGSSLQASEFEDEFLREGEPAVWRLLEDRYHLWLDKSDD